MSYTQYLNNDRNVKVFVRVSDRKLLQELAHEKLRIEEEFAAKRAHRVQSTILKSAPHLAWTPV